MRKTIFVALAALMALTFALPASARSEQAPVKATDAIWADGDLYGTVLLGALKATPRNAHSFDTLYLVDGQAPVAEAAHGQDYNGGRWLPTPVSWNVDAYPLMSAADVLAAAEDGHVTIHAPVYDAAFLCPLIP